MAIASVLDSFLDESSDQQQKDVFCVTAVLASDRIYKPMEDKWVGRLQGVKYFRTCDCAPVRGPFEVLRRNRSLEDARRIAVGIRDDLEGLLLSSRWIGFSVAVVMPEYRAVLDEYPITRKFWAEDPTVAAYSQVMYEVVATVRKKAKDHGVAFVVDSGFDSDGKPYDAYRRVEDAFQAMKINHPDIGQSAKTCAPLDDRETPALQMADLMASIMKGLFIESRARGERTVELGKWYNHFERVGWLDREQILRGLVRTLRSPRLAKGTLARHPMRQRVETKSERKQRRRAMWKGKPGDDQKGS